MAEDRQGEALDAFVARLKGLSPDQVRGVLAELDPAFVNDVFRRMLAGVDAGSRKRLVSAAKRMEEGYRPATDDELYRFIVRETGFRIPRVAVCEGNRAPFEFFADVFFERGNPDKLAVGNRGSGKTQVMGLLHAVNARMKPKYTSTTIGAVEAQSLRAYGFFKEIAVNNPAWSRLVNGKILMGGTEFTNNSKVEIVIGTMTGVNSPHPILAHWDEVELLRPGVFDEGLNMVQSKDGYRAMNVLTSSWKKPKGFVSELVDEEVKALREGRSSPYEVYRWACWETVEVCPHDCDACPFADDIKGVWEDGSPRSFESSCKKGSPEPGVGKAKFADGFVKIEDLATRFRKLPRRVWDAQQESKRPTLEGLVYDVFDEDMHTVDGWRPDAELGSVTLGIDFGGTAPHAAVFVQHLDVEVQWRNRRLPEGSDVIFDEVYVKDVGNVAFGIEINRKIEAWRATCPGFSVEGFFRDPAAKAAGLDLRTLSSFQPAEEPAAYYKNIDTLSMGHVDVLERIALVYELMGKNLVYVDRLRCESFMNEVGGYEYNEVTKKPRKEDDHLMDAMGYRFWNCHAKRRSLKREQAKVGASPRPRAVDRKGLRWDPAALGTVPAYNDQGDIERAEAEGRGIGMIRRPRLSRDIFGDL